MTRAAVQAARAAAGLAAVLTLSCGQAQGAGTVGGEERGSAHPGSVLFVQAPAGALDGRVGPGDFRQPVPPGSRVLAFHPDRPEAGLLPLSDEFSAAGLLDVSFDGRCLLLCGRAGPQQPWRVYERSVDGGPATPVSPAGANATGAAYLPGDRVVLSCDLDAPLDPRDHRPAFSLYTCGRDGSDLRRITFNPSSDVEPTVLEDGRVLYSGWLPPGPGRPAGGWALLTVRRDGTGLATFRGAHRPPLLQRRPVQVGPRVAFLAADGPGQPAGVTSVKLARPLGALASPVRAAGSSARSVAAWDDATLLVSLRPGAQDGASAPDHGLYLLDVAGEVGPRCLLDEPGVDELDARRAVPRPVPRGYLSSVNPDLASGELLVLDARRSDRDAALPGPARSLRVFAADLTLPGAARRPPGRGPAGALLGSHPLSADGSVYLTVPADTPLRFETLDAEGRKLQDSHGWVWVRPGERRACIGCHEDRETAPPNRAPAALAGGPRDAASAGLQEGTR